MTRTSNNITEVRGAAGNGPRRARNLAVAFAAVVAVAAVAPGAAFAGNGVVATSGSSTNISGAQALGTTTTGAATTIKKTFYVYTTDSTLSASDRTTNFSINSGTAGKFGKVGSVTSSAGSATCSYSTNTSNQTFSVRLQTAGGLSNARRECKFDVEFALNQDGGSYSESMSTSGQTTITGLSLTATVTAAPAAAIWDSTNSAAESSHSYPNTVVANSSANYTYTLKNTGNVTLATANTQSITGTDANQFSIVSTTCGATLARGATCTVTTKFNPTSAGAKSATLNWSPTYNSTSYAQTVSLSGTGIAQTRLPVLYLEDGSTAATSYDYGQVGTGAPSDYTFVLKNTGNYKVSGTNNYSITGSDSSNFTVTGDSTCGATLETGASCNVVVRFQSAEDGARSATLTIGTTDESAGSDPTVSLSALAVTPTFIPSLRNTAGDTVVDSHSFPDTVSSLSSTGYVFTLVNTGNATLTGTGAANQTITGTNADSFTKSTTCGDSLITGDSCTITVRFTPPTGTSGDKTATLNVNTTNGDPASVSATLSGTAILDTRVPVLQNTAGSSTLTTYAFPDTVRGETNSYTFTLRNTGNTTINGVGSAGQSITGTNSNQFSITGTTCGTSLATNATCTVTVRFQPTTTTTIASKSANLVVNASDATSGNPVSVALTGLPVQDVTSVGFYDNGGTNLLTTKDLGTVNVGSSGSYTFKIKNNGNVALNSITIAALSGDNSSEFTKSTTCGSSLAVGASCDLTLTSTPTEYGVRRVTLGVSVTGLTANSASASLKATSTGGGVYIRNDSTYSGRDYSTKLWSDTISIGGRSPINDRIRAAFDVALEPGHDIQDVLISSSTTTNDTAPADSTFAPVPDGVGKVRIYKQPGGGHRAYVFAEMPTTSLSGFSTGIGDGTLCLGSTAKTNDRRIWFQLKDDQGKVSAKVGARTAIGDANWACNGGTFNTGSGSFPLIDQQKVEEVAGVAVTQSARDSYVAVTTPGTPVKYSFQCQRKTDSYGCTSYFWRIRNSLTGQMFVKNGTGSFVACTAPCTAGGNFTAGYSAITLANPSYGVTQYLTTSFPARGRWVVEGIPGGGGADGNAVQYIGQALVNTEAKSTDASTSPTISVSGAPAEGSRPNTNSSWNLSATVADPSDPSGTYNSNAGSGRSIEWDLDRNATNGAASDGFDDREVSGIGTDSLARTLDLTGKTPGTYTIRARVTDNGAFNVGDPARASKIWTRTFTVNSPPVATNQTVDIEADETQPKTITLAGTDADGDPLTYTVPNGAGTGTVGGSNGSRTYTWPSTYTGTESFTFVAADDHNASGNGTLTVRVRPNTTIDTGAPLQNKSTKTTSASFTFSSPQSGVVGYECRLSRDGSVVENWAPCSATTTGSKSYSDLPDGGYTFEARAKNSDAQVDGTPASWTWRVDNTPPVARVLTGPSTIQPTWQPRPTNDTTPAYRFDVDDKSPQISTTYECRWKGDGSTYGDWTECGGTSLSDGSDTAQIVGEGSVFGLTTPLAEGVYAFQIRATDEAGNLGDPTTETFRIDTTPASTAITNGPEGLINFRDLYYTTTSTEPGSSFVCKLTAESGTVLYDGDCQGVGYSYFLDLPDGKYSVAIGAKDPATNVDPNPATAQIEIDATVPTTSLISGPVARTKDRRGAVSFSGYDSRKLKGFECRIDSSNEDDWQVCSSPETYSGLADGDHVVEIRGVDEAGNRDATPASATWAVDQTPPSTTIDSAPAAESDTATPTVAFSGNETSTFECSLDGGSWRSCTSPLSVSSFNGGPLGDGGHRLLVRGTDVLNNLEATPALASWRSDTVAPSVALLAKPADPSPKGDAEVSFALRDGSPAADAPELDATCSVDGGAWSACTSPVRLTNPAAGSHTVSVKTSDAAGNASEVVSWSWTVISADIAAPTLGETQPANGATTTSDRAQITFSHPQEDQFTLECRLDDEAWDECPASSTVTLGGLSDGAHTFDVRASDSHGNHSPAASVGWTVNTAPPGTNLDGAPSALTREQTGKFRFSSDRAGATFECRLDRGSWAACESPFETTTLADGRHRFEIRSLLDGLYDQTPIVRSWTIDSTAPETQLLESPPLQSANTDAKFAFRSNDRYATFQCKLDEKDYQSCATPTLYTRLKEGAHALFIRAVDPAGNRDDSPVEFNWQIKLEEQGGGGTVSGNVTATLVTGGLVFPGLSDQIPLPAGGLSFVGDVDSNGSWTVSKDGATFPKITQAITAGGLNVVAKIAISATGGADGTLPKNGGPASLNFPAQLKVVVETDTGAVLIGESAGCYLRPIDFRLAGTYDPSTQLVTLNQPSIGFPKTSAGCGALGATVDSALGLPRSDISIATTFRIEQTPTAGLLGGGALTSNLLKLPVSCPKVNIALCSGLAQVTSTVKGRSVVLGKARYAAARGSSSVATIALPKSVTDAVAKAGAKGLAVKISLTPTGAIKSTFTKAVRLYDLPARKRGGAR